MIPSKTGGFLDLYLSHSHKNSSKKLSSVTRLTKIRKKNDLKKESSAIKSRNLEKDKNTTLRNTSYSNTLLNSSSHSLNRTPNLTSRKNFFSTTQNTIDMSATFNNSKLFHMNSTRQRKGNTSKAIPSLNSAKNSKKKMILSVKTIDDKKSQFHDNENELPSIKNTLDSSTTSSRTKTNNTFTLNRRNLFRLTKGNVELELNNIDSEKCLSIASDCMETARKKIKSKLKHLNGEDRSQSIKIQRPQTPKPFDSLNPTENSAPTDEKTKTKSKNKKKQILSLLSLKNTFKLKKSLETQNSFYATHNKILSLSSREDKSENSFYSQGGKKNRKTILLKTQHSRFRPKEFDHGYKRDYYKKEFDENYCTSSPKVTGNPKIHVKSSQTLMSEPIETHNYLIQNEEEHFPPRYFQNIDNNLLEEDDGDVFEGKLKHFEKNIRKKTYQINDNVIESKEQILTSFYHNHFKLIDGLEKKDSDKVSYYFKSLHNLKIEYHPKQDLNSKITALFEYHFISHTKRKQELEKATISFSPAIPFFIENYFSLHLSQKLFNERILEMYTDVNFFSPKINKPSLIQNFSNPLQHHNFTRQRRTLCKQYQVHQLHHRLHEDLILPHYHGIHKKKSSSSITAPIKSSNTLHQCHTTSSILQEKRKKSLKSASSTLLQHLESVVKKCKGGKCRHQEYCGRKSFFRGCRKGDESPNKSSSPRRRRHKSKKQTQVNIICLREEDIAYLSSLILRDYVEPESIEPSGYPSNQNLNAESDTEPEKSRKLYQSFFTKIYGQKKSIKKGTCRSISKYGFKNDERLLVYSLKKSKFYKRKKFKIYENRNVDNALIRQRKLMNQFTDRKNLKMRMLNQNTMVYKTHELKYLLLQSLKNPEEEIFFYIKDGNFPKFLELFEKYKIDPDIKDNDGNSLLSLAVQSGSIQIVNELIYAGASVNTKNNKNNTPLHYALTYHNYEMANILIKNGAYENVKNRMGATPWECINPNISIV